MRVAGRVGVIYGQRCGPLTRVCAGMGGGGTALQAGRSEP